jgi:bifunctional DNase/RNase
MKTAEVTPYGLVFQNEPSAPIFIFKVKDEEKYFPISLDFEEGDEIFRKLQRMSDGLMPSGLAEKVLKDLGWNVRECHFGELRDNYLMANLVLKKRGGSKVMKVRASEALGLCLQGKTKYSVSDDVLEKSRNVAIDPKVFDSVVESVIVNNENSDYLM